MMKTNSSKNENYFICFYTLHFLWNKQAQKFLLFKKKTIKFSFFNSSKTINQSTPLPTVNCSWSRTTVAWSVLGHQGSNIAEAYSYQQTMEHNEGILSRNSMKLIHNFNKRQSQLNFSQAQQSYHNLSQSKVYNPWLGKDAHGFHQNLIHIVKLEISNILFPFFHTQIKVQNKQNTDIHCRKC